MRNFKWPKIPAFHCTLDLLCFPGLLCIPCLNADSERGFSVLRKVHTDQRASLSQDTIIQLFPSSSITVPAALTPTFLKNSLPSAKRLP